MFHIFWEKDFGERYNLLLGIRFFRAEKRSTFHTKKKLDISLGNVNNIKDWIVRIKLLWLLKPRWKITWLFAFFFLTSVFCNSVHNSEMTGKLLFLIIRETTVETLSETSATVQYNREGKYRTLKLADQHSALTYRLQSYITFSSSYLISNVCNKQAFILDIS